MRPLRSSPPTCLRLQTQTSERSTPQQQATLRVHKADGSSFDVPVIVRIDTPVEKDYYRAGGILPYVLAQILG